MKTDPEALAASLRRLAQRASVIDLVPTLREVTEACVDIFGVSGSGIMIADEQNVPHYVAASDGAAQILEAAESNTGQGPCTEAFVTNEVITSSDLRVDSRWPELALAVAGHQVRAVVGLPVRLGAAPVGTLDVYLDRPHE